MQEKIENRLKVLYDERVHLKDKNIFWIGTESRTKRLQKCETLINELETLLK